MDMLVKIFTDSASNSTEACRKVEKAFNNFMAESSIDRIKSITTNTTNVSFSEGWDCWFTYTLTLVYEPHIAQ